LAGIQGGGGRVISVERIKARWQGVLAPLVTPFAEDGSLDLESLRCNVQWLIDRGASEGNTIFLVAGSGGDFPMMNLDERCQVIRTVAEVADGRVPIVAGAQSLDIRESIAICQLCESLEIDAVQISGPFYYDGRPDDVIAWLTEVGRHTGVGFAIYNNWYTGYDMPLDLIERLLDLPNSVAVKWASPNFETFLEGVRRLAPRVAVINNTLITIPGHVAGCRAFVSHFANFYPEFCWRVWDLMKARQYDEANEEFERVMVPYRTLVKSIAAQTAGEAVFVRPAMAARGLNGGHSRLPSRDAVVTPALAAGFRALLAEVALPA
jgi:4-hydroxy-tetrahydrodipicolinate synthase